jgi:hypothetical protein
MKFTDCSYPGCSVEGALACPHGQWCGQHVLTHQKADNDCRILFAETIRIWTVKVAMPLIIALKRFNPPPSPFEGLPVDEVEREIFPAQLAHLELAKHGKEYYRTLLDTFDRIRETLERQLDDVIRAVRESYEGEEMPFGLDDEAMFKWLEEHMQSRNSQFPEN